MTFLDLIFPKECLECKRKETYICETCLSKVEKRGVFINSYFSGLISLWKYEKVIKKAILKIKYKFASDIAKSVANLASNELSKRDLKLKNFILVPIPLYKKRENWRGFNQAEIMGKIIAKNFNWDFKGDFLVRKINTRSQVELKKNERRFNIKNAFVVNPKYISLNFKNRKFIIFDDVYTTGSTLKEGARVLKNKGIKEIWGLTIAR